MHAVFSRTFVRSVIAGLIVVAVPCLLPDVAVALKVKVNCNQIGQTIGSALAANAAAPTLVIVVKGTCTENVVITRDDVTIKTNGVAAATVVAADNNQHVLSLDGARRIVVDGVVAAGLTVSGGNFGIAARRGSTLNVRNCAVTGASNTGIIGAHNSVVSVDACSATGNGNGITAANTSTVYVTNSTITGNAGSGLVASRGSYLRVGQDESGSVTVKPVTVSGGGTGIAITENSSGNVVGGTVSQTTGTGIFVGRGSSGQIGLGSNGLTGGVSIINGLGNGISVEGGNATIVFSTISDNLLRGIVVSNGGSARIGVTNVNSVFGANTISGNDTDGIGVFSGSTATIGGNTIDANGISGINVGRATVDVIGGNAITNNLSTGIFVGQGHALIGSTGFGAPSSANTISGNGSLGPNNGGIFAFQGGTAQVTNATISNNTGPAIQAFETAVIELRGSTAVTVPAAGTTDGASIQFGSTLRVRDTASIVATGHGISASNLTPINIRDGNTVQGGAGKLGVNCFTTALMTASAATLTGNVTGVSGGAGPSAGCNLFQ